MIPHAEIGVGRRYRHPQEAMNLTRGAAIDRVKLVPELAKFGAARKASEIKPYVVIREIGGDREGMFR